MPPTAYPPYFYAAVLRPAPRYAQIPFTIHLLHYLPPIHSRSLNFCPPTLLDQGWEGTCDRAEVWGPMIFPKKKINSNNVKLNTNPLRREDLGHLNGHPE